jgi:hypothetical protein
MFNINDEQVNYHTLSKGNTISDFSTSNNSNSFNIEQESGSSMDFYWMLIPILLVLAILSFRKVTASKIKSAEST